MCVFASFILLMVFNYHYHFWGLYQQMEFNKCIYYYIIAIVLSNAYCNNHRDNEEQPMQNDREYVVATEMEEEEPMYGELIDVVLPRQLREGEAGNESSIQ